MTEKLGESQKMNSAEMLQKLKQGSVQERTEAAEALARIGTDAAFAVTELAEACGDQPAVSEWAIAALEELGPPPTSALSALAELTGSNNTLTTYWAITLLGRAGPEAVSHQEILADMLETSDDMSLKQKAAWSLGRIHADSARAMTALKQAALSGNARLSRLSRQSLQQSQT